MDKRKELWVVTVTVVADAWPLDEVAYDAAKGLGVEITATGDGPDGTGEMTLVGPWQGLATYLVEAGYGEQAMVGARRY